MNSFNPLQSITNAIMAHVPDTTLGQGLAIGAVLLICIGAVLFYRRWAFGLLRKWGM